MRAMLPDSFCSSAHTEEPRSGKWRSLTQSTCASWRSKPSGRLFVSPPSGSWRRSSFSSSNKSARGNARVGRGQVPSVEYGRTREF
jgi:hypothetical protein